MEGQVGAFGGGAGVPAAARGAARLPTARRAHGSASLGSRHGPGRSNDRCRGRAVRSPRGTVPRGGPWTSTTWRRCRRPPRGRGPSAGCRRSRGSTRHRGPTSRPGRAWSRSGRRSGCGPRAAAPGPPPPSAVARPPARRPRRRPPRPEAVRYDAAGGRRRPARPRPRPSRAPSGGSVRDWSRPSRPARARCGPARPPRHPRRWRRRHASSSPIGCRRRRRCPGPWSRGWRAGRRRPRLPAGRRGR